MASTNTRTKLPPVTRVSTFEGAPAIVPQDRELIRRLVLSNLLWEDNFYVDGKSGAEQIQEVVARLIRNGQADYVRDLAVETRKQHNLRHVPLWLLVALAKAGALKASTVSTVVSRPDEMGELLSQYWKANNREGVSTKPKKLSKQLQKGLAESFEKFDPYQLAKWNRDKDISLKDVMFLVHPKAGSEERAALYRKLVDGTLEAPDTWEVGLSAGNDKKETFERLLRENKLGYQALLMNLRNMREAKVDESLIFDALRNGAGRSRMLPFQFISAAKHNISWEHVIEEAMLSSLAGMEKLKGTTVLMVDVSGSMSGTISEKSDLTRLDAAAGLAMLLREVCEDVRVYRYDDKCELVAARRGFALREAIGGPRGGTYLGKALKTVEAGVPNADRIIVFTDEQSADRPSKPYSKRGYILNVATYDRGVGYGDWVHINGFSESVVKFVHELERGE